MDKSENTSLRFSKLWVIGLVSIVTLIGLGLVLFTINLSLLEGSASEEPLDALATSQDDCVTCHRDETPGIVQQFSFSTMAAAEVSCRDCHEVAQDYPAAV